MYDCAAHLSRSLPSTQCTQFYASRTVAYRIDTCVLESTILNLVVSKSDGSVSHLKTEGVRPRSPLKLRLWAEEDAS